VRLLGSLAAAVVAVAGLASPSYAGDDYPYRSVGSCPVAPPTVDAAGHVVAAPLTCARHVWYVGGSYGDPWGFALRNCTSFVAWRLRETNGIAGFSNDMGGGHWGDANHWDDNARALGYRVDGVPAVGAVAQTDAGAAGHVAWVVAVGAGTVTVEEYNYAHAGFYDVRTVPASDFRYLHLADLAPLPTIGSTRTTVAATDALGRPWTARVSRAGALTVTRPAGTSAVGPPHLWSPLAAPALAVDGRGRTWLAAVTRTGRVEVRSSAGRDRWSRPTAVRPAVWSRTASPALATDGAGVLHLVTVSAWGDLFERHRDRDGQWSAARLVGARRMWSPHAAPALKPDAAGRLWLVAVDGGGTLRWTRMSPRHGWSRPRAVDARRWSGTSSPALTLGERGRLWLHAVTVGGRLVARPATASGFGRATTLAGVWSAYASPAVTRDGLGRLWVAAVDGDGRPRLGAGATPRRWSVLGPVGSMTTGPGLVGLPTGGARAGADGIAGRARWWRVGATVTRHAPHRGRRPAVAP
jgi:surface antigen